MATLYFNAAVDNDWNTLGNWWTNSSHTTPASGLPTSSDSVILSGEVSSNSGSAPTIVNLTATNCIVGNVSMTVTGVATFTGNASPAYYGGTLTGNATFDAQQASEAYPSGASLASGATVSGNATFTNGARNYGTVSGNGTFTNNGGNGDGSPGGTVNGNATFDATSGNRGGTVGGNATFTGATYSAGANWQFPTYGVINGSVTFSSSTPVTFNMTSMDYYENASGWTFTGGTATWNMTSCFVGSSDGSVPKAVVKGNCNMTSGSFLRGDVTGDLFMHTGLHANGTVSGLATYDSAYVWGPVDGYAHAAGAPFGNGGANFRNGSYAEYAAYNGECKFDPVSAQAQIQYGNDSLFQTVSVVYGKGVNGSSILGIV